MKKIFTFLLFLPLLILINSGKTYSQSPNSWINYNQSYYKIKIASDGLYRIDYNTLQAAGIPSSIDGKDFRIFGRGVSIPIYVSTQNTLSTSDYIEFYALKNDGWLDSTIYNASNHQANDKVSMFNDTAAYFLTWNSNTNTSQYTVTNNNVSVHPPKENYCWYESTNIYGTTRDNATYIHGRPEIQGQTIFDSDFSMAEGYIDYTFNHTASNKSVPTPYPYTSGPLARLKAQWCGKFPTDHLLQVSIGSTPLTTRAYFGFYMQRFDTLLPSNSLLGTTNTVVTFNTTANPITIDYNGISNIAIKYPRQFNFDNTTQLKFSIEASGSSKYLEIYNFDEQGTLPVLYDITNRLRLVAVNNNDTLKFLLPPSPIERELVLCANTSNVIKTIAALKPITFVDYSSANNKGDFIIIAHPYFMNDGSGNDYVNEYKLMKNSHGYQAVVVDINQLYDQFAYGIDLHPACIRNFTDYVLANWNDITKPKNILLIGKGTEFQQYNITQSLKTLCYIPTWGFPGSDILLTSTKNSSVPRIPIGRLSILNHTELLYYKNKVDEYEDALSSEQTIENKAWTKRVLHLAGGENADDQFLFQYILNTYADLVEDSVYFGGDATMFSKNSSAPISVAASEAMDSLINTGVSLITFFGHSSFQSLDFNLNDPYDYNNIGKYPLIVTNGCLVGNLFAAGQGLSADFTYANQRGSIGFLAPSSFSVSNSLELYTNSFYKSFTKDFYNSSIGELIKQTVNKVEVLSGNNNVDKTVAQQMLFCGDPSLIMNTYPKPDYAIENTSVYFNPSIITAGVDSFDLNLIVSNIGKAIDDSIYVDITRIFPDGQQSLVVHELIRAPYNLDTFSFKFSNNYLTGLGLNQFIIKVDAENSIDEVSENNNTLLYDLIIQSDDILPVSPHDYSIVTTNTIELKGSTVNPFISNGHFIFQIDTTELFNSPLLKTQNITQNGAVVRWIPNLNLLDSTVYYWRTSIDTIGGKQYNWHNSSFTHIAGSSSGWSQSHYFQYLKNKYTNVVLPSNRIFKYVDDVKNIASFNGITTGYGGLLNWDEPSYYINNVRMANWTCGSDVNWLFAIIDSATGIQWESISQGNGYGQFGNYHCYPSNLNAFYFSSGYASAFTLLENFIDTIPVGNYVLAMSINNAHFDLWDQPLKDAFASIGAMNIDTITTPRPYVLFAKKGDANYTPKEVIGSGLTDIIDTSFNIVGQWDQGFIESAKVGPSSEWQSLHWKLGNQEINDEVQFQLIGIKADGTESLLVNNILISDTNISGIDASVYPYVKMKINFRDTTNMTVPQLEFWRINFQPEPELAINPIQFYSLTDTVNQFSQLKLSYAIANVSNVTMNNVKIKYSIIDAGNNQHIVYNTIDSFPANDTVIARLTYTIDANSYFGINKMIIEINPFDADHKEEQYHFNNLATTKFVVTKDNINPLLDVTFDGIHILDGDLISAKPEIMIRLKDDSKKLALNDSSAFKIKLIKPDATVENIIFDGITNEFIPADSTKLNSDNTARALLKPLFTDDGKYQLIVQGYDKSGNASGNYDYRVGFEVINKAMISNVLNYPNPFTTKTQFVFTITGSSVPEFMKIQIMTVTGKIVKEIFKDELGELNIGRNITDYAWDGKDQYGDDLANGLYLYRVVTRLTNQTIEHYETSIDKYFDKGFGKMYLMR
jgi:hypothetical protein